MAERGSLRPLTGFGSAGWALLPVALGLVAVLATGYDLRYKLMEWSVLLWGLDGPYFVCNRGCAVQGFAKGFGFSAQTVCVGLLALFLMPRRPWDGARFTLLVLWGFAGPLLRLLYLRDVGLYMARAANAVWPTPNTAAELQWFVLDVFSIVLLAVVFRSWIVLVATAALHAWVWTWLLPRANSGAPIWMYWPPVELWYDLALGVLLVSLAVWRRRTAFAPGACRKCSYDLRGLVPTAPCPECGAPSP